MSAAAQIVVIGGGVVGLSCAFDLQRAGARVLLLDPPRASPPASYGNAGHIAVEQVDPLASPAALRSAPRRLFALGGALDFRLSEIGAWGGWALRYIGASTTERAAAGRVALSALLAEAAPAWRRLATAVGRDDLLIERGHLVLWESPRTATAGRRAWAAASPPGARPSDLPPAELDALGQWIKAPLAGGIAFAGTGQVRHPQLVLDLLKQALLAAGGRIEVQRATRLAIVGDRAAVVLESGETLTPESVVVAGGVGSGPLMRSAGHEAPVVAERGYHLEASAEDWGELPPLVFEDRSMILTRFGDRLRAASFVEFSRDGAPPDPAKWARLDRHLRELGIAMPGPVARWVGARPTLPDYLPAIGESRRAKGLYYAFGHQHLGLTLAALTGELVCAIATGARPAVELAPFDVRRFEGRRRRTTAEGLAA